jgi:peptide/nickel transport system permease protein
VIPFLLQRLLYAVFVLWGAVTVVFLVLRVIPADPALLILGVDATPEQLEALRQRMGLDSPVIVQYFDYLVSAVQLDFGISYRLGQDAMSLVMDRVPATASLAFTAMLIAVIFGLAFGLIAALQVDRWADRAISAFTLALQSFPLFWIGLVLILIFARALKVLPSGGNGTAMHYILPALALSVTFMALLARLTRSGLLEVINEGYIHTARAKGLYEKTVVFPHAIRNALIPIVTVAGLQLGQLLGGAVIVETVFAWPGVGRLLIEAINSRDYNVVQACVMFIAAVFVLINLVVDVVYGLLDPRIRIGGSR